MKTNYQILVIGGGTGGIMTAAQFLKKDKNLSIAIIEPADTHWYQPAWTLVGAGTFDLAKTKRSMASVMPSGVDWIKDYAIGFNPQENTVRTKSNGDISYEYLVVSPGLVMAPELIEGLPEALDKGVVCSNYTDPIHTWNVLKNFKGGNALFTQPSTPIKCGGAPQKIMYLAAHYFKKNGLADKTNVIFATPGSVIFGVPEVKATLEKVLHRYKVHFKPFYAPFKIDAEKQIAYFKDVAPAENNRTIEVDKAIGEKLSDGVIEIPFDMLHLAPPQAAPKFVRDSELANADGWLDVNINSLQHNKFENVFGIGDVAALPTAKTGAAIRKQVPLVVENISRLINAQKEMDASYNGYSSCPLVTGYGKMVLAEFDYNNKFTPDPKLKQMLIFNSAKEHWRLWMLKKFMLPYLYWNKMLKGKNV
jgi:sulfide:quinone oxidoreductase